MAFKIPGEEMLMFFFAVSLLCQLLFVVLQGVELVVPPMPGQQLLVGALLQNFTVGQHDDVVRVLDGGQAVRHNEHRADGAHLFQRILNQHFGFGVNVGRGFVKNHDLRLVDQRPRKGNQLAPRVRAKRPFFR